MKKSGFLILENIITLVIILTISLTVYLGINFLNDIHDKYKHNTFKIDFLNFINLGKYRAFVDSSMYTLRFSETGISLVDKRQVTVDKFNFPSGIKMIKFNGIYNKNLTIQRNGLLARGATFTYKFNESTNNITISAVTGKVNYD